MRIIRSYLRQFGLSLGIVTSRSRPAWRISAKHVDLGSFASWIFDDDVAAIKPSPEGLILAFEHLHLMPEQALYLGDSLTDIQAAFSTRLIQQQVTETTDLASITKRCTPHLLRHAVATTLLEHGMSLEQIQEFLGHAKIDTTQLDAESATAMIKECYQWAVSP